MAGSRYVRADLHVHTLLAAGEVARGATPTVDNMVSSARASGISVLGITDHNTAANLRRALDLATTDLLILPGIAISTSEGHVLGLFAPAAVDEVEQLARPEVLRLRPLSKNGEQRSTRSMADLIADISERGGIAIAAHIDTAHGLLSQGNAGSLADILAHPGLNGLEITRPESVALFTDQDADAARKLLWRKRRSSLGIAAPLARIMSSDAHSPDQVGADTGHRTLTRLRVDDLNFLAIRAAILVNPDARCRVEANLEVHYPRVLAAHFEGGFLDGMDIEFSQNLNCLIGGRGSGKSTVLEAIQGVLAGEVDVEEDAHPNRPDYTEVTFVDELGSTIRAGRKRYGQSFDLDEPDAAVELTFTELEQNFGGDIHEEDPEDPAYTRQFLLRFLDEERTERAELDLLTRLHENGSTLRRTTVATAKLKELDELKVRLTRKLTSATDAELAKVATYARILANEAPLLEKLGILLDRFAETELPFAPDLATLAEEYSVDLTRAPAVTFVAGSGGLEEALDALAHKLEDGESATRKQLVEWLVPSRSVLAKWTARHSLIESQLNVRRKALTDAGLTLQVDELDRIRIELKATDESIRQYLEWQNLYRRTLKEREELLAELSRIRERRHATREATCKALTKAMNLASAGGAVVGIKWQRAALRAPYAERLGQLFDMRSPRKERLAAAIDPAALAVIGWSRDAARLRAIGGSTEQFFPDPQVAFASLVTFNVLFELETMDLEDRPDVSVRFRGEGVGRGRSLSELSLGQLRSVLLGFILASRGTSPLIFDQPEDHLDAPFVADTVVGYLHGVKEQRQLIIATHNPNLVVLGDAELVVPLRSEKGVARIVDAGSVDNERTRTQVVRLLEGGMEAFERRARRYGLDVKPMHGVVAG